MIATKLPCKLCEILSEFCTKKKKYHWIGNYHNTNHQKQVYGLHTDVLTILLCL